MPFNALVQEKILDFEQQGIPEVFPRDLALSPIQQPERGNLAQVVVGTRRCGKTYRLYQEMHDIVHAGYSPTSILYFNFEDERLSEFCAQDFNDILLVQKELSSDEGFFFLDEVQNIDGWEKFARRLADSGKRTFITGSNAAMLSHEIATTLGGR